MEKKLIIAVIAAVMVIGVLAGYVKKPPEVTPTPKVTPTPEVTPTPTPTPTLMPTPTPAKAKIGCVMCHELNETKKLSAHWKGGKSCLGSAIGACHNAKKYGGPNATVHTIHSPKKVACTMCHKSGREIRIPKKGKYSTCENCHGYPNPLKTSGGHLVQIHLKRGKTCKTCHSQPISEIHKLGKK